MPLSRDSRVIGGDGQMAGRRVPGGFVPRADRFQMALPVRYRRLTEESWREGQIENISGSGILFRAGAPLELAAKIELAFSLPSSDPHEPAASIHCKAEVVRLAPPQLPDCRPGLAAAITRFRFSAEGRA
jgi:PilZ domain